MFKIILKIILLSVVSHSSFAITPTFNVMREIDFGRVFPATGSCRMNARTGVISAYIGQNICILTESVQTGHYTIIANPNKIIRVKVLPNHDTGDGIVFNPYIELISAGVPKEVIYNNIGFKEIDSGADGIVDLYMGGDLIVSTVYAYGQTVNFSFINAIEWHEEP